MSISIIFYYIDLYICRINVFQNGEFWASGLLFYFVQTISLCNFTFENFSFSASSDIAKKTAGKDR